MLIETLGPHFESGCEILKVRRWPEFVGPYESSCGSKFRGTEGFPEGGESMARCLSLSRLGALRYASGQALCGDPVSCHLLEKWMLSQMLKILWNW